MNIIEQWLSIWFILTVILYNILNRPDVDGDYWEEATWLLSCVISGIITTYLVV